MAGTTAAPTPASEPDVLFKLNPVHPTDKLGAHQAAVAAFTFYAQAENLDLARQYRVDVRSWIQNFNHNGRDRKLTESRFGPLPEPPMAVEAFVLEDLSRMELRPTSTPVSEPYPIPPEREEPPPGQVHWGPPVGPWWPVEAYYATHRTTVPAGSEEDHPETGTRCRLRLLGGGGTGMSTAIWEATQ